VTDLLTMTQAIDKGSYAFVLVLACVLLSYLYLKERKANEKLHERILDNSKELVTVIKNVEGAVSGFTNALQALRPYAVSPQFIQVTEQPKQTQIAVLPNSSVR
jgi:hypothetical protein